MINKRMALILALALILLFTVSCRLSKKPVTYTTTLEGIAVQVPSLTGGIINKLNVQEGEWIPEGDTLAILDSRELRYQVEQIDASLLELAGQTKIAVQNLNQAQKDYAYVLEKQQRTQRLSDDKVVPQQNLDDINNLLEKSKTQNSNASSQYEMLKATAEKLVAQKKILLKKINDAIIISPAAGKVTTLYYRQGEAMAPYANLLEVVDTDNLEAKVYVSEAMLSNIHTQMLATVITETGQKFPALIKYINNKAEFTPKTILTKDTRSAMVYAVKLEVANSQDILKDGMPVEVEF
jgi:HlyD family secretion protein